MAKINNIFPDKRDQLKFSKLIEIVKSANNQNQESNRIFFGNYFDLIHQRHLTILMELNSIRYGQEYYHFIGWDRPERG